MVDCGAFCFCAAWGRACKMFHVDEPYATMHIPWARFFRRSSMLYFQRLAFPVLILLTITGVSAAQAPNFTILHSFTGGSDGEYPATTLALAPTGKLYGTTSEGGSSSECES